MGRGPKEKPPPQEGKERDWHSQWGRGRPGLWWGRRQKADPPDTQPHLSLSLRLPGSETPASENLPGAPGEKAELGLQRSGDTSHQLSPGVQGPQEAAGKDPGDPDQGADGAAGELGAPSRVAQRQASVLGAHCRRGEFQGHLCQDGGGPQTSDGALWSQSVGLGLGTDPSGLGHQQDSNWSQRTR